jgi:hypothetical protein
VAPPQVRGLLGVLPAELSGAGDGYALTSSATARSRPSFRDWAPSGGGARTAHLIALALGGLLILWLDRDRWFLYDEWAFPALIHPLAAHGHWARFFFAPFRIGSGTPISRDITPESAP